MKLAAARPAIDADDIKMPAHHLGITTADQALTVVLEHFSPLRLLPRTRYLAEEIFSELDGPETPAK